ncbi:MAG: formate--tetrahydrofolate ligase [Gammaproteobacteria bacterium]|jgi:formate--tetrahydrofolate ligase|nr:formate--tetrahydrofolate ligase [Gammaproteobacteria bacterium]
MRSDIEIAREARLRPIAEVAAGLGLTADELHLYGPYMAKVPLGVMDRLAERPDGKLILVTAMTPTKHGEGKTTTTIGLTQALARLGQRAVAAIREPSLGPCMGLKGGAAGGGYAQVLPMEEINLHFTGDLHAVTAAHNLLAAVVDNHLHQGSEPQIHPRKVLWKRVIDMNDRALRSILIGLEGGGANGVMREDGFEITAASEIMAIWGLASDLMDLKARMGRVLVGFDALGRPIQAADLGVQGAMAALMKNAMHPNLVQTIEGVPAFVHGGPFANIAHGCNTLAATRLALKLADVTVTEAGFGADLGAEKFLHIKCRTGGLAPSAVVLVVTRRAFRLHGLANVAKHVENLGLFGVPVVICLNRFLDDGEDELAEVLAACRDLGVPAEIADYREAGGAGGLELAERVLAAASSHPIGEAFTGSGAVSGGGSGLDSGAGSGAVTASGTSSGTCAGAGSSTDLGTGSKGGQARFTPLYDLDQPLEEKVEILARRLYGADGVDFSSEAQAQLKHIANLGFGDLPICVAKTPASLSDDPKRPGRPTGFRLHVKGAKVSAGAGFVVIYTGSIMTMPGLPKCPAAQGIDIDRHGTISGLF